MVLKAKGLATREKLAAAGADLIRRFGYDTVTVDQITQACGVSKGTFYLYFESKEELFYRTGAAPLGAADEKLAASADRPLLDALRAYAEQWWSSYETLGVPYIEHWLGLLSNAEARRRFAAATGMDDVGDLDARHLAVLTARIETAVANGAATPAVPVATAAQFLLNALYGSTVRYCMAQGELEAAPWVDDFVATARTLLRPTGEE